MKKIFTFAVITILFTSGLVFAKQQVDRVILVINDDIITAEANWMRPEIGQPGLETARPSWV